MARLRSGFDTARDLLSFLLGAGILVAIVARGEPVDPIAAGLGATLVGLPAALTGLSRPRDPGPPRDQSAPRVDAP